MAFERSYDQPEPSRDDVNSWPGASVLEFGADWCPHCQGAQRIIESALEAAADVKHVKVADGKGKPLGRSFQVKLWPTLIFMKDGQEMARTVRPTEQADIEQGLSAIA